MRDPSDPATPPPHGENKSDTKRSPGAPGTRGGGCPGTGHPGPRGHTMEQLGHPHPARGGDQADAGTATHRCRSAPRCLRHGSSLPPPPGLLPPLPLFVIPLSSRLCSALLQLLAAIIPGTAAPADCSAPLPAAADRGFNDSPGHGRAGPTSAAASEGARAPAPCSAKPSQLVRPGQG